MPVCLGGTKQQKSANSAEQYEIVRSVYAIYQEYQRRDDEERPRKRGDRFWEIAGVIGLWLATTVGLAAIWIGTTDAERQRGVLHDQLEDNRVSQRPWIFLSALKTYGLFFVEDGISIPIHYSLINSGRTPGIDTKISFTAVLMTRVKRILSKTKLENSVTRRSPTQTASELFWFHPRR